MPDVKWPTPSNSRGGMMEGKRSGRGGSPNPSQLCKLQNLWRVNTPPGFSQGSGAPDTPPVAAPLPSLVLSRSGHVGLLCMNTGQPFLRPLPLPLSQPGTLFPQLPGAAPFTFPSGSTQISLCQRAPGRHSVLEETSAICPPSHLLSSPWCGISSFAGCLPTGCDRETV